jgi:predicted CXXCH cytochrome family protein
MPSPDKTSLVLGVLTVGFLSLAYAFLRVPARPALLERAPLVPRDALAGVITPGTVRISAAQLASSGGDTSGLSCYSCHHQDSPPVVKTDAQGRIVLPREHADLIISMRNCVECHAKNDPVTLNYDAAGNVIVPAAHQGLLAMAHGRNFRNENCYNCHDRSQLDQLHTAEGAKLRFDQATLLCAGCHGPTYRDWEAGVHGRTGGYWERSAGPIKREECTSCHDPHAPAFTGLIPMPGPHLLHPQARPPQPPDTDHDAL